MPTDYRPLDAGQSASTPGFQAHNFKNSGRLSGRHVRIGRSGAKVALVRRCLPGGRSVLDGGGGEGASVALLRHGGYDAGQFDCSDTLVAGAMERYPDARWVVADTRASGLPDSGFDRVISWLVIKHEEVGAGAALENTVRVRN